MFWLLPSLALAQVPPAEPQWTPPAAAIAAVREVQARPVGERIEAATRAFLGLPYLLDGTGEGGGIDPDPPARYDRWDCMTLTEEALGMALAGDPVEAATIRDALRYHGKPAYESRNHFMEAEWIPRGIASGLIEDITDRVGHARTLTHDVTLQTFHSWRHLRFFHLPDELLPVGAWSLRYLDLAEAYDAAPRIPPGAIVVTLRVERTWAPVVTSHVSLAIPGKNGPMMRHASKMGRQIVRDDKLDWYMEHLRDYVNWPALGVTVLLPREQGPTIANTLPAVLPALPLPDAVGDLPHFEPKPLIPFAAGDDPA